MFPRVSGAHHGSDLCKYWRRSGRGRSYLNNGNRRQGAGLHVTTQAAEKIYRSLTEICVVANALRIAGDGLLLWLPQETILFDGARLSRHQVVWLSAMIRPRSRPNRGDYHRQVRNVSARCVVRLRQNTTPLAQKARTEGRQPAQGRLMKGMRFCVV
ncbi:MAG: urease accessory protein UreD [Pseudomonadota bacterium]|nr:urease accessory protein UreD [Pseudomonadota bacterium]